MIPRFLSARMSASCFCAALMTALSVNPVRACTASNYSAADVANAIRNSPYANSTLKDAACDFGGAAQSESGGNLCSDNGNNYGILQLTRGNLPNGMTPEEYKNLPLQQQIDIWAKQVGNSNTSGAYKTLDGYNGQTINGVAITSGTLAACFQFGPLICKNDLAFIQAHGACPSQSNGGVRATRGTLSDGSANLDGNYQSICSWGKNIQGNINRAAANCRKGASNDGCPISPDASGGVIASASSPGGAGASPLPGTSVQPAPTATDVVVAASQI